jgi:hypothetical protein
VPALAVPYFVQGHPPAQPHLVLLRGRRPVVLPLPRFRSLRGAGRFGLGAALSPTQIYQTAVSAGFPADVATQMTAIALRESGGNPLATNLSGAEQSYGLWQINVRGNPGLLAQLGLSDPLQLLDPSVNARAALKLWGGNPQNLNTAWYLDRPGYAEAYQRYLPVAEAAAAASGGGGFDTGAPAFVDVGMPATDAVTAGIAVGLLGLALAVTL